MATASGGIKGTANPFSLYDVAPRLARARDQRREELRIEAEALREREMAITRLDSEILHLQRLVAHRELHLLRVRGRKKVAVRTYKLQEAQKTLSRYEQRRKRLAGV